MVDQSTNPIHILSFGAGVNTFALMVLLIRDGAPLDGVVFADTGGETPDTYKAVEIARSYFQQHEIPFSVVQAQSRGTTLYGTALRRRVIPSVHWRWCTRDFKVNPIHKFYRGLNRPVRQYVGIAFDEIHRMRDSRDALITNLYPLVDKRLTRQDCVDIISQAGLPVPERSGCYFCPFNSSERWKWMLRNYPDLFEKAIELEEHSKHFPRQRLTDQVFRERDIITLRQYRKRLEIGDDSQEAPDGIACGGECMT